MLRSFALGVSRRVCREAERRVGRNFTSGPGKTGRQGGLLEKASGDARVTFQRSHAQHKPKTVVGILAFGVASGALSCIAFYEMSRCDSASYDDDDSEADSFLFATEPLSNTKFPLTLMNYGSTTYWLVSKTVRCMLGLCSLERARAYSYAIYLSSEASKACSGCKTIDDVNQVLLPKRMCEIEAESVESEAGWESKHAAFVPANKFQGEKLGYVFKLDAQGLGYYKDTASRVALTMRKEESYPSIVLRMVMLRDVDGAHIAHGFDRTLLGRVRSAQNNAKEGTGKASLRTLNQFIERHNEGKWRKGQVLEFVRLPQGELRVRVDGYEAMTIHSEALSWAMFDAFIGTKGHMGSEARKEFMLRTKEVCAILKEN